MRLPLALLTLSLVSVAPAAAQSMGPTGGGGGTGGGSTSQMPKPPSYQTTRVRYYPQALIDSSGKVSLKFIVDTAGHPEPGSIEITKASDSAFAEAARMTVLAQEYRPASDRGTNVRAASNFELKFKPGKMPCSVVITSRGTALCVDSLNTKH